MSLSRSSRRLFFTRAGCLFRFRACRVVPPFARAVSVHSAHVVETASVAVTEASVVASEVVRCIEASVAAANVVETASVAVTEASVAAAEVIRCVEASVAAVFSDVVEAADIFAAAVGSPDGVEAAGFFAGKVVSPDVAAVVAAEDVKAVAAFAAVVSVSRIYRFALSFVADDVFIFRGIRVVRVSVFSGGVVLVSGGGFVISRPFFSVAAAFLFLAAALAFFSGPRVSLAFISGPRVSLAFISRAPFRLGIFRFVRGHFHGRFRRFLRFRWVLDIFSASDAHVDVDVDAVHDVERGAASREDAERVVSNRVSKPVERERPAPGDVPGDVDDEADGAAPETRAARTVDAANLAELRKNRGVEAGK